jgi:hypothetical protein
MIAAGDDCLDCAIQILEQILAAGDFQDVFPDGEQILVRHGSHSAFVLHHG